MFLGGLKINKKQINQVTAVTATLVLLGLLYVMITDTGFDPNVFTVEFVILLALAVVLERIRVPSGAISISLNFALIFSALIILGFYPAIWIAAIGILFHTVVFSPRPASVALLNSAMYGLMTYAAGMAYIYAGGIPGTGSIFGPLPVIAFMVVNIFVNHFILISYIKIADRDKQYTGRQLIENVAWDGVTYLVSFPLAVLMILLYNYIGTPGIVVMVIALALNSYIIRLYKKLDLFHRELRTLQSTSVSLIESIELDEVLQAINKASKDLFGAEKCAIWIYDENKTKFWLKLLDGDLLNEEFALHDGQGITGKMSSRKSPLFIYDLTHPEWKESAKVEGLYEETDSLLIAPLVSQNRTIGSLNFARKHWHDQFDQHELKQLTEIFAAQAGIALANALHHQKIEDQAVTDEKTNLFNYRYFYKQLENEIFQQPEQSKTLLMMDLDDFKLYNDRFGHPAGDNVLGKVAKILKDNIREGDTACRYGGEEFSVLLVGASGVEAEKIAERIRSAVANYPFPGDDNVPQVKLTVSIGGAEYPGDGDSAMDLIRKSDQALYLGSKQQGKNRVSMYHKITEIHSVKESDWNDKIVGFPSRGVDNNGSDRGDS